MRSRFPLYFLPIFIFTACHKDDAKTPPPAAQQSTGTGTSTGTIPIPPTTPSTPTGVTPFPIFDDELKSGGGAFVYPDPTGSETHFSLSFAEKSNAEGTNSILFSWDGQNIGSQHVFVGFDLMHTPQFPAYATTPGKNLSANGYTKVTFDARGNLPPDTVVKVEVSANGVAGNPAPCVVLSIDGMQDDSTPNNGGTCQNKGVLRTTWQSYKIPVSANDLGVVKDFFKATFIYRPVVASNATGQGGTVVFDQILYQ